ncbi:MAG: hypothetical protein U9R53_11570 [Chloroflexota bacterium]|nr:hypothetical protein [Chloroflexota bacterium]
MIRKRDLIWLFLIPLYLIMGTFRHEFSHALVAHLQGAEITKFTFWPSIQNNGTFYFGYVTMRGETSWLVDAAPYLFDILTYAIFFPLVFFLPFRKHWIWLNLVIIGVISPIINSLYNYLFGSDVEKLLAALPDLMVHGFFLLGLGLSFTGLVFLFTRSHQAADIAESK